MDSPASNLIALLCVGIVAGLALTALISGVMRQDRLSLVAAAFATVLGAELAVLPGGPLTSANPAPLVLTVTLGLCASCAALFSMALLRAEDKHSWLRRLLLPAVGTGLAVSLAVLLLPASLTAALALVAKLLWLYALVISLAGAWQLARHTDRFAQVYLVALVPAVLAALIALVPGTATTTVMGLTSAWLVIGFTLAAAEQQRLVSDAKLLDLELLLSSTSQLVDSMQQSSMMLEQQLADKDVDVRNSRLQMEEASYHDRLTGLPNRRLLTDRFAGAVAQSRRSKQPFSLVVLDIDRLKAVNERYGRLTGDAVLRTVAKRVGSVKRDSDTFARMDNDDFVLLLPGTSSTEGLQAFCDKIMQAMAPALQLDGLTVEAHISLGAAVFTPDYRSIDALYTAARQAMVQAKTKGGNSYQIAQAPTPAPALG